MFNNKKVVLAVAAATIKITDWSTTDVFLKDFYKPFHTRL